jgi:hypothetical protein
MDQCLKAQICRTERWFRRPGGRSPSGDPAPLGDPYKLLVAYETKTTTTQMTGGTQLVERDLIIAEEELCNNDRVYESLAAANADDPIHILREARSYPDLSCGAALNAVDHYEAQF